MRLVVISGLLWLHSHLITIFLYSLHKYHYINVTSLIFQVTLIKCFLYVRLSAFCTNYYQLIIVNCQSLCQKNNMAFCVMRAIFSSICGQLLMHLDMPVCKLSYCLVQGKLIFLHKAPEAVLEKPVILAFICIYRASMPRACSLSLWQRENPELLVDFTAFNILREPGILAHQARRQAWAGQGDREAGSN